MNSDQAAALPGVGLRGSAFGYLTVARLMLVPVMALSFMNNEGLMALALLAFMVGDLFDGVLARGARADGPRRRAADSIVDHVAIDVCLLAALAAGAMPAPLVAGFLARDLYLGLICRRMFAERGVAIKADMLYRGLNFLFAAWALSAARLTGSERTVFAVAVFAFSLLVALDLRRAVGRVHRTPAEVRDRVIGAGELRRPGFASTHGAHLHQEVARTPASVLA
jgi:phosphatidylglycerophosphate synthase